MAAFPREDGDHRSEDGEDEKVRADHPGKDGEKEMRAEGGRTERRPRSRGRRRTIAAKAEKSEKSQGPYHADREDPSRNSSTRPTPTISSVERRVDKILANRVRKLPSGAAEREFLVQWKKLPKAEASWEREDALRHEEDKIREYQQKTSADTSG
uniref:Chromo domain-containing protein n=1 Tax=Ananas comosus var. bracteatus TaxID=296719 RepID=A0A6V7P9U7_ANACO|nr:unnamed protein product [Ananas comosus var. bracteatus]